MSENQLGAVVVTGAARRLGRAIALGLAATGRPVAVHHGTSQTDAQLTVTEIESHGGRAVALAADIADEKQAAGLITRATDLLGPVEVLINNASIFEHDSVTSATRESWDRHLETNLRAPFVLIQELAASLNEGRKGSVINILDERVWNLTPHFISYTLSKVGPGPTLPSPRQSRAQFDRQAQMMPLGRGTSPEEVARAVLFILESPAMTGQMIALDGGQHLGWAQPQSGAGPVAE